METDPQISTKHQHQTPAPNTSTKHAPRTSAPSMAPRTPAPNMAPRTPAPKVRKRGMKIENERERGRLEMVDKAI